MSGSGSCPHHRPFGRGLLSEDGCAARGKGYPSHARRRSRADQNLLKRYLCEWMGGPKLYSAAKGPSQAAPAAYGLQNRRAGTRCVVALYAVLAAAHAPLSVTIPLLGRCFAHSLISHSTCRSMMRRATDLRRSECGITSKYFDRSASTTSCSPDDQPVRFLTASTALRRGR